MKVLVLQLARLGDIYQTWPVLRAFKRQFPTAEIHLLTRQRFVEATHGLEDVLAKVWRLDSRDFLGPLVDEKPDVNKSVEAIEKFVAELQDQNFTRLINLSFSPFSSYLTKALSTPLTEVFGYSRHSDGFLSIPDDASAYFYAQVGPGRMNRLHVTDLFAQVAQVDLQKEDWGIDPGHLRSGVVVHIGASDSNKTFSVHKWQQVVRGLQSLNQTITLIGSAPESPIAEQILSVCSQQGLVNLVGKTSLQDLFQVVANAQLLVGGDSGPIHVAALVQTPVLNVSLDSVNFYETGPRSPGSRILVANDEASLASDTVIEEAKRMLAQRFSKDVIRVEDYLQPYKGGAVEKSEFAWEFILALYMGHTFPVPSDELFLQGIQRLSEVNSLAIEQIQVLRDQPRNSTAAQILDRVDEIIETICKMIPTLAPLIRWFQTEKIRLGPMPFDQMLTRTENLHSKLQEILNLYFSTDLKSEQKGGSHDDLNMD